MPIITKPSPLEKDATGIFSLDKTALAIHPTVVASAHFSSPNVWDKIIVKYKSETLGQFESIEFDATVASPEGQFFVSSTAEDVFEVEKITIIDKDGAILLIPRADLTVAEFDIDFGAGVPQPVPVMWLANPAYVLEGDGGATASATRPSYGEYSLTFADPSQYVTGDFTLEAVISSTYNLGQNFIGFYDSTTPTITTAFTGASIYFEQAIVASYSIPTSPTYTVKIQRVGLNVKFYVNDVEKYSGTHTDINKAKVPFFTFTDNAKYIVSASLTLPESVATYVDWTERANYTTEVDGGLTSSLTDRDDGGVGALITTNQTIPYNQNNILTFKMQSSVMWQNGQQYVGFISNGSYYGFWKYHTGNKADFAFLYNNSVNGGLVGQGFENMFQNNSTELTLQLKMTPSALEYYVNGTLARSLPPLTLNANPVARIYQGDVLTEAYFE